MILYQNNIIFSIFLAIIIIFLSFYMGLNFDYVGVSFLINCLAVIFLICVVLKENISSILFFYIFNLLFFCFVPWVNYTEGVIFWSNEIFSKDDYFFSNILIFFINFLILFFYKISPVFVSVESRVLKAKNFSLNLLICFFCSFIIFNAANFNIDKIFFRGILDDDNIYEYSSFETLLIQVSRFLPAFIFIKFFLDKRYFESFIFLFFLIFCAFPTGIPRYLVAYIYIPVLLIVIPSLKSSRKICSIMIFSMIILFPFLNEFRYYYWGKEIKIIPDLAFFNQAHFDAYQNFMEVIRVDYITYGKQILVVMLFFIPRSFWESKPIGSGAQLAIDNNYIFTNISMPYIAEGYVNFGYIGIIIFILFASFFMKQIDFKYLNNIKLSEHNFSIAKGVFFCAAIFFISRGDLLSSFAYMISGVVAFKIVEKI
ncbi:MULTISPECIES: O-antigen polysaccharide polymerase Wzy [Acinetobacter]|uniref:O-antigen polysaccharide polymerase Wzy n=1 Tax=Acinetobacter TaxID=469 RepID=UPI00257A9945|nr:O-antigen polysaccharide polymerase Wzy [Acinetobacter sp. UBA5984]